jgi:hypothetical protein
MRNGKRKPPTSPGKPGAGRERILFVTVTRCGIMSGRLLTANRHSLFTYTRPEQIADPAEGG